MTGLEELPEVIRSDRKAVYNSDLFRSMIFVLLAALALWLYLKGKIKENLLLIALGFLIVLDLAGVDRRYVNSGNFVSKRQMNKPFAEAGFDKQIKADTTIFRVYDPQEGVNGARTSFFHYSIGGYHGAKPAGMEDLFEFHIYSNNVSVLNMLNVKYVIQQDEEEGRYAARNPEANGNAWFVTELLPVANANEEIQSLDTLDNKIRAVFNAQKFPPVRAQEFTVDSTASIELREYTPNRLLYRSVNPQSGLAVFSEMYYERGWKAYIDGVSEPYFRVNYTLRALKVPAGEHQIEFRFEPGVVETGSRVSLASIILLILLILAGTLYKLRPSGDKREES
jgi:hypothetical protein